MEEVALVRGEAKRWEARVNELLLKYSSVDLAEYTRVTEKLKVPCLSHPNIDRKSQAIILSSVPVSKTAGAPYAEHQVSGKRTHTILSLLHARILPGPSFVHVP